MSGTRLSLSRRHPIPTLSFKTYLRKDQREFHTSHLKIAWCSTFSPCFPSTRLSKRSITSWTCSRSPSVSACINLCIVWSNSMSTLCRCHASATAQVTMPLRFQWTFCSPRLNWGVMFSGCVHSSGRTNTTSRREVSLCWTCVCSLHLFRLLSMYVHRR